MNDSRGYHLSTEVGGQWSCLQADTVVGAAPGQHRWDPSQSRLKGGGGPTPLTGQILLLQKIRSKHLSLHPSHLTHFTAALNGLTSHWYGHDLIMVHACFCVYTSHVHRNRPELRSKHFSQGCICVEKTAQTHNLWASDVASRTRCCDLFVHMHRY